MLIPTVAGFFLLAWATRAAIEPSHMQRNDPPTAPPPAAAPAAPIVKHQADPIGGFILPSFGVSVSYKPAAEPKQPVAADKPAAAPKPPVVKTTTAAPSATTTTAAQKPSDEEARKKKEQEEAKKKKEQEEAKKKKEQEEERKRKEQEDQKRKKEQDEQKRKKEEEEKRKKADQKPTNQLKPNTNDNKRKRSPVPTRYEVPNSAGIAGVGGGAVPDPGFVLEPRDLFQQAENSATLVGAGLVSFLSAVLATFALLL